MRNMQKNTFYMLLSMKLVRNESISLYYLQAFNARFTRNSAQSLLVRFMRYAEICIQNLLYNFRLFMKNMKIKYIEVLISFNKLTSLRPWFSLNVRYQSW